MLTSKGQQDAIVGLERASESVTPPVVRLEHALQALSEFVVIPLFAFSNAGVTLTGASVGQVSLGVALGLALGKSLGITGAPVTAISLKLAALPEGVSWTALHGCAWLGGIGFTMSLFTAMLAYEGSPYLIQRRWASSVGQPSQESSVRHSCGADFAALTDELLASILLAKSNQPNP